MTCERCGDAAMVAVETVWKDGETPRTMFLCLMTYAMTGHMRCTMPTSGLRSCQRTARYIYELSETSPRIVAGYCAQHYRAGGHARMLRPRPWEYSRIVDTAAGITVHP